MSASCPEVQSLSIKINVSTLSVRSVWDEAQNLLQQQGFNLWARFIQVALEVSNHLFH